MGKLRPCVSVDIKDSSDRHHHQEIQFKITAPACFCTSVVINCGLRTRAAVEPSGIISKKIKTKEALVAHMSLQSQKFQTIVKLFISLSCFVTSCHTKPHLPHFISLLHPSSSPPFVPLVSSSDLIPLLYNPSFPFLPFPVCLLLLKPVQSDPIVVFLSISQGQHFRDLLIGLELSIPSGWITENRCKSPPAWKACSG